MVIRHQLHVLGRQVRRPVLKPHDRALAAPSRVLPRGRWASLFVRPETIPCFCWRTARKQGSVALVYLLFDAGGLPSVGYRHHWGGSRGVSRLASSCQ